jgi:hypothetical protein
MLVSDFSEATGMPVAMRMSGFDAVVYFFAKLRRPPAPPAKRPPAPTGIAPAAAHSQWCPHRSGRSHDLLMTTRAAGHIH